MTSFEQAKHELAIALRNFTSIGRAEGQKPINLIRTICDLSVNPFQEWFDIPPHELLDTIILGKPLQGEPLLAPEQRWRQWRNENGGENNEQRNTP